MFRFGVCVGFLLVLASFDLVDVSMASVNAFASKTFHTNRSGDIILSFRETFFTNTIPLALPFANEFLTNITIPPQHIDMVDVDKIYFSKVNVGGASLNMTSPNNVLVGIQDTNLVVPNTGVVVKSALLTCEGHVRAAVNITTAEMSFNVNRLVNGSIRVEVLQTTIEWKDVQINHTLESPVCDVVAKILEALHIDLDKVIADSLKKKVREVVGPLLEEKAREFFDGLQVVLTEDPDITFERAIFEMEFIQKKRNDSIQLSTELSLTEPDIPQTDFGLVCSEISVNEFVRYIHSIGVLNQTIKIPPEFNSSLFEFIFPPLYTLCPKCPFVVAFDLQTPPLVELDLNQTIMVYATNVIVGLDMVSPSGTLISGIETLVNFTGGVKNLAISEDGRLLFRLTDVHFAFEVSKTKIYPINVSELSDKLSWFLNTILIPLFNVQFTGVTLPAQISNAILNLSNKTIFAGVDIKGLSL